MSERRDAKKDFKIGMAHVGCAAEFCVESGDKELARAFYRDLTQRARELAASCGLNAESISDRRAQPSATK
jgi:hypothetical protein